MITYLLFNGVFSTVSLVTLGHGLGTEAQLVSLFNDHEAVAGTSTLLVVLVVLVAALVVSVVFIAVLVVAVVFVTVLAVVSMSGATSVVLVSRVVLAVAAVIIIIILVEKSPESLQIQSFGVSPTSNVLFVDDLLELNLSLGGTEVLVRESGVVSVVRGQGVGGNEVFGFSDDAVSWGDEVGGFFSSERSTESTNSVSETVGGLNLNAASIVVESKSMVGHVDDDFSTGQSVDLSNSLVLVVGDFSNAVLGGSLVFLVDLDFGVGTIVVGGRGLHVNNMFSVVQDDFEFLFVFSGLFDQDGDVFLSLGFVVNSVVFSLFGSRSHEHVPRVFFKVQWVGLVVEGLTG